MDSYIQNLEDCWRRSVALNIDFEQDNEGKLGQLRHMREDVRATNVKSSRLEEALRAQTMEVDDYKAQYDVCHIERRRRATMCLKHVR